MLPPCAKLQPCFALVSLLVIALLLLSLSLSFSLFYMAFPTEPLLPSASPYISTRLPFLPTEGTVGAQGSGAPPPCLRLNPCQTHSRARRLSSLDRYKELGVSKFADAKKVVFTLDHNVQDHSGPSRLHHRITWSACHSHTAPISTLTQQTQQRLASQPAEGNLKKYGNIEAFAKANGVDFYPAGRGIGHQVLCEEGYVFPNRMVVASDSHSNM